MDLMNKTLAYDKFARLSLTDFAMHPWMMGPCLSSQEVTAHMMERKQNFRREMLRNARQQYEQNGDTDNTGE